MDPVPGPVDVSLPQLSGHTVRRVPGFRAGGPYRCPECDRELTPGEGHVVVWPDEQAELRRHWHLHCWRLACRRGRIT